jgi:hypothetical protein
MAKSLGIVLETIPTRGKSQKPKAAGILMVAGRGVV